MTDEEKRFTYLHKAFKEQPSGCTLEQLQDYVKHEFLNDGYDKIFSIKTIQTDLKRMMDDHRAPIEKYKQDRKTYFHYGTHAFNLSFNKFELGKVDKEQLIDAFKLLNEFNLFNPSANLTENLLKINAELINEEKFIFYEANPNLKGFDHLNPIYSAIREKRVIQIDYEPFDGPGFTFQLHPYILKEYNKRWYVFGWNDDKHVIENIALDRIAHIYSYNGKFIQPKAVSFIPEDYFASVVGVSVFKNLSVTKIDLRLTNRQGQYTRNKPIHSSQTDMQFSENSATCSISVRPNYELLTTLWSLGDGLIQSKPSIKELKKIIEREVKLRSES